VRDRRACHDGKEAIAAIAEHQPTVAVLDMMMPDLSGLDVARQAAFRVPKTAIVLFTLRRREACA
jgi:CheY-like chemotaxis protein